MELDHNLFTQIDEGTFSPLSLLTLSLDYNRIEQLAPNSLSDTLWYVFTKFLFIASLQAFIPARKRAQSYTVLLHF